MARLGGKKLGIWGRLKRLALTDVGALVRGLNARDLEQIEQLLLEADFGVAATVDLIAFLEGEVRKGHVKTEQQLHDVLRARLAAMLTSDTVPGSLARPATGPAVVLVLGVNGVGKTTTVAKLARRLQRDGLKVLVGAADTWRAGAVAQLETWAERLDIPCVSGKSGGDPAAVAYDAVDAGIARGMDIVIIDTAGRLHTQDGLMSELEKIARVIARKLPGAPHEVLLVLDGTVGQNAVQQGKIFSQTVPLTGLIVTKLDGTAKGGAVVALQRELNVPIRFLGLGEGADDLEPFDPEAMADILMEQGGE